MTNTYKIDLKHQYQSAKYNLLVLAIIIPFAVYSCLTSKNPAYAPIPFWSIVIIIPSLPAIFFHFTYYRKNKNQSLIVDRKKKQLTIKTNDEERTYSYSDISYIIQQLGIHYKGQPKYAGPARNPVPWTNYGYIKIKFRDGAVYFFTSLMIDVLFFDIGFPYVSKYNWWPYLKKKGTNIAKNRIHVKRAQQEKLAWFKGNFGDHTEEQLHQELARPKNLSRLEIEAIKELLAERAIII